MSMFTVRTELSVVDIFACHLHCLTHFYDSWFVGHSERAMLYHELEDGMYSVTSYFFAKVLAKYALCGTG